VQLVSANQTRTYC